VVPVAHRQCKEHEWMGEFQWRLSFSRAEIVLINSRMPVQQIVYHMLRYFIKTERLTECADNSGAGTLSKYHIKTLMLWAGELKPTSSWTENLNLVRICVELLHTLSVWLTDTRCPHYFINDCNLLDNSFNVGSAASKLVSIDEEYLSTWFVNNYIRQCAQLCPDNVTPLFNDASTTCSRELGNAVSGILCWRLKTSLYDMWCAVDFAAKHIPVSLFQSRLPLTAQKCAYWKNELAKIDERLSLYFSAVTLLHVAGKITRNGFSNEFMDMLSTVLGCYFNQCCSVLSLGKPEMNTELVELLEKSALEHLTSFRQLEARDFGSVATIVTTDYEAMYAYKLGDYQQCLQLSTQNVHTLLYADPMPCVPILPAFIQLLDDDIVSLTALAVVMVLEFEAHLPGYITQLILSLYLMTQCQLKLRHSVTSLARTLDYIKFAQRSHVRGYTLDQLTLKLIECKVLQNYMTLKADSKQLR